ncbi:MAG: thioredoxin family protein [Candidatus Paceibacterota bacterium]
MEENNSNKGIITIIVVLLIIGFIAFMTLNGDDSMEENILGESEMMMEESETVPEGAMMESTEGNTDAMMEEEKGGAMMEQSNSTMTEHQTVAGSYEAYSTDKLALANEGDVVLFFHASWCPSCRAADKSIKETGVPDGLTILKLDYDKETELKKKYGVTTQHTFIQVDADGNLIKKWSGASNVDAIVAEII